MKRSIAQYAVVIGVGLLLTLAITQRHITFRAVAVSLGTALLAGFYEMQKAGLRAQTDRIIGDLKHHVNNALQGIIYAREIQPGNEEEIVREGLMRVRKAFSGSALLGDISPPCQADTVGVASRKPPQSQQTKPKAWHQGYAS